LPKFPIELTWLKPGPTLPIVAIEAENEVIKSTFMAEMTRVVIKIKLLVLRRLNKLSPATEVRWNILPLFI